MAMLDSLIKIATEHKTKAVTEKNILSNRLTLSVNKIIASFQSETVDCQVETQKVHMQVIENILYQVPDLIDDNSLQQFFAIKNDLDSGAERLPLSTRSQVLFPVLSRKITEKRNKLRICSRIWMILAYLLVLMSAVFYLIWGAATTRTKWAELIEPRAAKSSSENSIGSTTGGTTRDNDAKQ